MRARYRRRSSLVLYWENGDLLCYDYLSGETAAVEPEVVALLHQLGQARSLRTLTPPASYDRRRMEAALSGLRRLGFLAGARSEAERRLAAWHWGAPARQFLFSTKDAHRPASRRRRLAYARGLFKSEPVPKLYKAYPGARSVGLDRPRTFSTPMAQAISEIHNTRRYARPPLTLPALSELLLLACGKRSVLQTPAWGPLLDKTTYSGGNRYPIEVYPVAVSVRGLKPGLYHYAVQNHRLELLKEGRFSRLMRRIGNEQEWIRGASVYFLVTALVRRTMWKYRHDYGARVVLGDAGHVSQNLYLAATSLGLGACTTWALNHSLAEKFLRIDGVDEIFLCLAMAGHPAGQPPRA